MIVTSEPVVWVLRWHADDAAVVGDPYMATATATMDDLGVVTLRGFALEGFDVAAWNAAIDALRRLGARELVYTRRRREAKRIVRVTL